MTLPTMCQGHGRELNTIQLLRKVVAVADAAYDGDDDVDGALLNDDDCDQNSTSFKTTQGCILKGKMRQ